MRVKNLLKITTGIIRHREARRRMMFALVLAAVMMAFLGSTLMASFLDESLKAFLLFWALCGWLTLTAILLAIFDIIALRVEAKRARKELQRDVFGKENDNEKDRR